MSKTLVIYYSQARGNTKRIAGIIGRELAADLEEIHTVNPYPEDYNALVEQGQDEVNSAFRPVIAPLPCDLAAYDRIFLGTPVWWYTMAPAVASFLARYSLKGKQVVLFITDGGWPGHALADMKLSTAGAELLGEKEFRFDSSGGSQLLTAPEEINVWLRQFKGQ